MAEGRRRLLTALLIAGLVAGVAAAETGWSASRVVTMPRTAYSVFGPTPECGGRILVDSAIRSRLGPLGTRVDDHGDEEPTPLARGIGEVLNVFGLGTVLQTYATCAEVCAVIPVDATRVTSLVGYVADGPNGPFRTVPFGRWGEYFHWEPAVDTTRIGAEGRLVCVTARQWLDVDRRAFLVVGYER